MWPRNSLAVLVFAVVACSTSDKQPSPDTPIAQDPSAANSVTSPDQSYSLMLPARWTGLIRTDTLSTAERGSERPGAMNIVYLPRDTTVLPQTLVLVAVYDSAAWSQVKAEGGPPPGDSLMSKNGRVYVLAAPQSNPFASGSVDAVTFDSLTLKPADTATFIRVP